ncbi:MAG TPA: M20/M25/M40 family metallo-hydrolase [Gemmatimonadales bacterium]|nr:M20/M25/M40 family metallo-hydrolase [Gemmatimonadales bacterium]
MKAHPVRIVSMGCLFLFCLAPLGFPAGLGAQTSAPLTRAAASLTAGDVARRIGIIAADSMMGRDTPSRGLDLTAQYVADQFRSFGLKPGGDQGSWFQRYPITRRRLDLTQSRAIFSTATRADTAWFSRSARYDGGPVPETPVSGKALLVSGAHTAETAERVPVRGKVTLYVPSSDADPGTVQQVLRVLFLAGPKALVVLTNSDSASFVASLPRQAPERTVIGNPAGRPVVLQVRSGAVSGALLAASVNLARIHSSAQPEVRELPELRVALEMKDTVTSSQSAPNTVGILEGSDPVLKDEYLVYSAHMDHVGITPGRADSINNGADDDASGTAGVVELAEAFSRPGVRPRRSIIFLTVSGEEKGLWGSDYFAQHPPVPLQQIVANVNMDMIGRNWVDTIVAIGKEHSDLGSTLERVNRAHRELGMTAIDDRWPEERFYFRSDHYNFARRGVPILFFFNGVHQDYHEVTDSPDKINSEKESRILKLLFYLGQDIANAAERPRWNPESYREIVEE